MGREPVVLAVELHPFQLQVDGRHHLKPGDDVEVPVVHFVQLLLPHFRLHCQLHFRSANLRTTLQNGQRVEQDRLLLHQFFLHFAFVTSLPVTHAHENFRELRPEILQNIFVKLFALFDFHKNLLFSTPLFMLKLCFSSRVYGRAKNDDLFVVVIELSLAVFFVKS